MDTAQLLTSYNSYSTVHAHMESEEGSPPGRERLIPSGSHGADGNHNDQDDGAGRRCYQRSNLTRLGPAELRLLLLQQRVKAGRVDVLHPELQVTAV